MLKPEDYELMKKAVEEHEGDFWQPSPVDKDSDHNIWLVKDIEDAVSKGGYELVLRKKLFKNALVDENKFSLKQTAMDAAVKFVLQSGPTAEEVESFVTWVRLVYVNRKGSVL